MNVLVVAPHADDEILGVGGTMARLIDEGQDVYVCVVTSGDAGMFPQEMLDAIREEAILSHKLLGVRETFFLDLPAVKLSETPKYLINQKIEQIIHEVNPSTVFIPHFGDMHLDHFIVSQSTMVAVRPIRDQKVLEVYAYETLSETEWNVAHTSNVFIPNTFVDISKYLEIKLKSMSCYASQLKEFPHPRSLQGIEALARLRGSSAGLHAAEAFCLLRRIVI